MPFPRASTAIATLVLTTSLLLGICSAGARAETAETAPRMRALLIGISDYDHWPDLTCQKDVIRLREFLEGLGVPGERIRTLTDADTRLDKKSTMAALARLVEEAVAGDTVVFAYAGHGFVLPDQAGGPGQDEEDGLDECLVPVDVPAFDSQKLDDPAFLESFLRDDDLEEFLRQLVDKVRAGGSEGSVVLIYDSCHSGSLTRNADPRGNVRTLPIALQEVRRHRLLSKRASWETVGGFF